MFRVTDDLRIGQLRPLIPPAILMEELPITEQISTVVAEAREAATRVVKGEDDRMLVIAGPCSIHDPAAAREYAERLSEYREKLADELLVVMRVYFEKPRTTVGWKGLINDPKLDGSFDINTGLRTARKLLLDLGEMGMPVGSEFLDTISPQFIADLISWGAIGARTTESQVHRELASGLSVPVGFKNGTDGNIQIALDAIRAARCQHHFLSVTKQGLSAIVTTKGNDACHVILRGSNQGPNYDPASVDDVATSLRGHGLVDRVMIDCSHGNSRKDYRMQPQVARDVAAQVAAGSPVICGLMLESHLVEGRQDLVAGEPLTYGQSITDACIAWEETVPILETLADAVRRRRAAAGRQTAA
jgi:3-deoxy-7-phosphoheptulonate synthase